MKPETRRHKGGQSFADFRSHAAPSIASTRIIGLRFDRGHLREAVDALFADTPEGCEFIELERPKFIASAHRIGHLLVTRQFNIVRMAYDQHVSLGYIR